MTLLVTSYCLTIFSSQGMHTHPTHLVCLYATGHRTKLNRTKTKRTEAPKVSIVTMAPGRAVATAGINSNVDVCEKAKHHTELFW